MLTPWIDKALGKRITWMQHWKKDSIVNVDTAYDPISRVSGVGMVIRNNKGDLMATPSHPLQDTTSPLASELASLTIGLGFELR